MGEKSKSPGSVITKTTEHQIAISEGFLGPLPHPAHLEKYEQILPGAADRIISMAESQSTHRQNLETKVISSDIRNSLIGLIFGFIIGLTGVGSGFYLIYTGKVVEGSIFGGGTIVFLVSTFIYGSRQRRKERESKK